MSEANVPSQHSHPGSPKPPRPTADASETLTGGVAPSWETVNLPGHLPVEAIPVDTTINPSREVELLNLVRDLNRCNEVLLGRVNQLEESLENAQQALQAEVEHHHSQSSRVDPAVAAQQRSMAQLLSELEGANDGLKRQRILAETLQAQLDSSQERVVQLERECTLLQQQQTAKSQSLQKSEETCQDLRSRLQRQQRYTLQFKVALEKCLDMSSPHSGTSSPDRSPLGPQVRPQPLQPQEPREPRHNPVAMPRADRIQPWSAIEGDPLPDPQLAALLRATHPQADTASDAEPPLVNPESSSIAADAQLWQDLERVVEQTPTPATSVEPVTSAPTAPAAAATQSGFTEPFPWGAPQAAEAADTQVGSTSPVSASAKVAPLEAPEPLDPTPTVTTWQPAAAAANAATINVKPHPPEASVPEIPLLQMPITPGTSPSPIVHPLRPQKKKLTSLSAVDLPSFPRPAQNAKAN